MEIRSVLAEQSGRLSDAIAITTAPHASIPAGLGLGRSDDENLLLSEIGRACYQRLSEWQQGNRIHVAEVKTDADFRSQVRRAFNRFVSGEAVVFTCRSAPIPDAPFKLSDLPHLSSGSAATA